MSLCLSYIFAFLDPRVGVDFFPGGSDGRESTCDAGDLGSIPKLGRSPGEGKGYSFQYSGLEKSIDCTVHGSQRVGHN